MGVITPLGASLARKLSNRTKSKPTDPKPKPNKPPATTTTTSPINTFSLSSPSTTREPGAQPSAKQRRLSRPSTGPSQAKLPPAAAIPSAPEASLPSPQQSTTSSAKSTGRIARAPPKKVVQSSPREDRRASGARRAPPLARTDQHTTPARDAPIEVERATEPRLLRFSQMSSPQMPDAVRDLDLDNLHRTAPHALPSPSQSVQSIAERAPPPAPAPAPLPMLESSTSPYRPRQAATEEVDAPGGTAGQAPDVATFLGSLSVPLTHLYPAFETIGCTTALDLVALAARTKMGERLRSALFDEVAGEVRAGDKESPRGLSRWDRMMLEEGLRELADRQ